MAEMKKNKKIALFVIVLILIITSGLVLSNANWKQKGKDLETKSGLPNNNGKVKITAFNLTGGWGPIVGLAMGRGFNITIVNLGRTDLEGLTLTVKMMNAHGEELETETGYYGPGVIGYGAEFGPFDGMLNASETRTLRGGMTTGLGTLTSAWAIGPVTTLVQVSLNGTVLDQFETKEG